MRKFAGGIILTASHNPRQWNALKLLNPQGEFLSAAHGQTVLDIADSMDFDFSEVDDLGRISLNQGYIDLHIDEILALPLVNKEAIEQANFRIVVDGVNSTGGIAIPRLLERLGAGRIRL